MIPWLCLIFVIGVTAGMSLIPLGELQVEYPTMFHILIVGLAIGWLSEIWSNRKRIKRKMVLLVFLGYALWVTISEVHFKFSDAFCRWESITLIGAAIVVTLYTGGCHESDT